MFLRPILGGRVRSRRLSYEEILLQHIGQAGHADAEEPNPPPASTADSSEVATEPITSARSVALNSVRDLVKVEKSCSRTLIDTVWANSPRLSAGSPPGVRHGARSW